MSTNRSKPLFALALVFVVAPLLAVLVSPWIYQGVQYFAAEGSVLDAPFYRVTSRVAVIMVAALLYPAYKLSGMSGRENWGLPKSSSPWRLIGLGLGLGIVSMLAVYLLGVIFGVFAWDPRGKSTSYLVRKMIQALAGGLFIGVFEEILFRGFIQNALRKSFGLLTAVLFGSFLFSIVHFMKPTDPEVVTQWNSGLMLLQNLFGRAGDEFIQEACTLFCMGIVLAMLTHWMKSVYVAIGLHAGWVWVMMFFRLFTQNQDTMVWLYGSSDWVSKAWMGPIMALVVLVSVVLTRKKWVAMGQEVK